MFRLIIVCISLLVGYKAMALEMEVKKVKGRKAVVVFSEAGAVNPGDRLSVGNDSGVSYGSTEAPNLSGLPTYSFTGGLGIESITYDSSGSKIDMTTTNIDVRFGWVFPEFEAGPILSIHNQSLSFGAGSVDLNALFLGGYGEYNFGKPGEPLIPAVGGILGYSSSELSGDVTGFRIEPYVRGKYFLTGSKGAVALGQLSYRYDSLSGNGVNVTGSGFVLTAGLGYYF